VRSTVDGIAIEGNAGEIHSAAIKKNVEQTRDDEGKIARWPSMAGHR
jgi:hypothetical protein